MRSSHVGCASAPITFKPRLCSHLSYTPLIRRISISAMQSYCTLDESSIRTKTRFGPYLCSRLSYRALVRCHAIYATISICTLDESSIRTETRFTTTAPIAHTWMRHGSEIMGIIFLCVLLHPRSIQRLGKSMNGGAETWMFILASALRFRPTPILGIFKWYLDPIVSSIVRVEKPIVPS